MELIKLFRISRHFEFSISLDSAMFSASPSPSPPSASSSLPLCRYGSSCYRLNVVHRNRFRHPEKEIKVSNQEITGELQGNLEQNQSAKFISKEQKNEKKGEIEISENQAGRKEEEEMKKNPLKRSRKEEEEEEQENPKKNNQNSIKSSLDNDNHNSIPSSSSSSSLISSFSFPSISSFFSLFSLPRSSRYSSFHSLLSSFFSGLLFPDEFFEFFEFSLSTHARRMNCEKCQRWTERRNETSSIGESFFDSSSFDCFSSSLALIPGLFHLVGPFEYFTGIFFSLSSSDFSSFDNCLHYRYYHDYPEAQTIAVSKVENSKEEKLDSATSIDEPEFSPHWFYWRDDPSEFPSFVGSGTASNGAVRVCGDSIFSAFLNFLDSIKPSERPNDADLLRLNAIQWANEAKIPLFQSNGKRLIPTKEPLFRSRQSRVVCSSLNGVGISVPVRGDVGYRPMHLQQSELISLCDQMLRQLTLTGQMNFDRLDQLSNLVSFANDECDFGCGLELYSNIYCIAPHLQHEALTGLQMAYKLLGRRLWETIIEKHIKTRGKRNPNQWKEMKKKKENKNEKETREERKDEKDQQKSV